MVKLQLVTNWQGVWVQNNLTNTKGLEMELLNHILFF
jgi:hypothetical protein